jgi:ABC-type sugar transport system substrate-binding protein
MKVERGSRAATIWRFDLRYAAGLLVLAALVFGVAACGDDDDDEEGVAVVASEKTEEAEEAGREAGEAAGQAELPSGVTVGILEVSANSEISRRVASAAREAVRTIGWDSEHCEGQGVPRQIASCGQSLLNQDVDVVLSIGNDPPVIARQLQQAKADDVPFFNVGGDVLQSERFTASYVPDDRAMTRVIDDYLFEQLEERGGDSLAIQTNEFIAALVTRGEVIREDLKEHPEIELVAENETDFANPVESVSEATRTVLTANSDLDALWAAIDFDIPPMARTARSVVDGELPIIVGFYPGLENLELMRQGLVSGMVDAATEATAWAAVDQAAQMLARGEEPADDKFLEETYPLDFLEPILVTPEQNMPEAENEYVEPPADFVTFFTTKWGEEFGIGGTEGGG